VRSLDSISHEAYRKGKGEGFKEAVLILCEFCANGRSAEHVKESCLFCDFPYMTGPAGDFFIGC